MPLKQRLARRWVSLLNRMANGRAPGEAAEQDPGVPSLRSKVMLVVLSTTCLALLLSAAALLIYELRAYRVSRLSDLQTQADIMGRATAPALFVNDGGAAAENLRMLKLRPQITGAAIYMPTGELFASYLPADQAGNGIPARAGEPGQVISGDKLELYHPIVHEGRRLGLLYLRTDYALIGRLIDYLLILLGVMAASTAAAALITSRLQRAVTEPILQVAQVARDVMVQRDFSLRAPKTSSDEVGQLVDAFNGMLTEVAARTAALEDINRHLSIEMTERRKAEEALRMTARKKDEFLATLAHELRNPLAPISNAIEILRRIGEQPSPLRQRSMDIMGRQLKQMVRLIDDLLDVSRFDTGKLMLHRECVDLVRVLHNALEIAAPMMEARKHTLTVSLPQQPVYTQADATRLGQVFANLLNNAAKYTADGGHINLSMKVEDGQAYVSVKDSGIGIAPEMQGEVFEMFVQVDESLDRGRAGLGVGLSLARRLARLHGGDITLRSGGLGQGTEFIVQLSLSPSGQTASQDGTDDAAQPGAGPALRVLVADDNVDFATSLASILESLGHEVTVVHDGVKALEAAQQRVPDLVFLDIGMPGFNGHELALHLRQLPSTRNALLVAVTGWSQAHDRRRSQASGISHHMAKPVEFRQLLPILAECQARRLPSRNHPDSNKEEVI